MTILSLATAAHKAVLLSAVEFLKDQYVDEIGEIADIIQTGEEDLDEAIVNLADVRTRQNFLNAFEEALKDAPVGISVYVEGIETDTLRFALERLNDVQDVESAVCDLFSTANIQRTIVKTAQSWGATDPAALSANLREQVREVLAATRATSDLLEALSE